jgi:uncharacterized coiled-coil protein SlyX
MKKIVKKTIKTSKEYLTSCGFKDEIIESMLNNYLNNMNKLVDDLEKLLKEHKLNIKKIDKNLHALKGLVAQLNNSKLANKIENIKQNINRKDLENLLS